MDDRTRRLALPLLLAGGLALSACSSTGGTDDGAAGGTSSAAASSASATTTAPTTAPATAAVTAAAEPTGADPTTAGGPDRCHTSELTGSLGQGDAAAGNRYATLTLTNTGGEVCTVHGYGGLGLVAADGSSVPSSQVRVENPAPGTVTLQPGAAVSAQLHWTVVATGSEAQTGDCEPTAARLAVIPPNETDALSVTWTSGPVCGAGRIEQTAYAAG